MFDVNDENTQEIKPGTESLKIKFEDGEYIGQEWSFFLTNACTNPLCPCTEIGMTAVPTAALKGDDSKSEAFSLTFDAAKKTVKPVKNRDNYKQCCSFADACRAEMPEELWQRLYTELATVKNSRYREIRDFDSLELDFSSYEKDIRQSFCIPYKDFFPFCDDLIIEYNEKRIMLFDQYCVNPNCNCSDVFLSFYVLGGSTIAESISTIKYNYRKKSWQLEDSIDNESENLVRQLLEEKRDRLTEIGGICKERHRILRNLYSRYRERVVPAELPDMPLLYNKKVGRNDPCPCGSGFKYKKCCGG